MHNSQLCRSHRFVSLSVVRIWLHSLSDLFSYLSLLLPFTYVNSNKTNYQSIKKPFSASRVEFSFSYERFNENFVKSFLSLEIRMRDYHRKRANIFHSSCVRNVKVGKIFIIINLLQASRYYLLFQVNPFIADLSRQIQCALTRGQRKSAFD